MSICKQLVLLLGGKLGFYNNASGVGSTFWFTLPIPPVHSDDAHYIKIEEPFEFLIDKTCFSDMAHSSHPDPSEENKENKENKDVNKAPPPESRSYARSIRRLSFHSAVVDRTGSLILDGTSTNSNLNALKEIISTSQQNTAANSNTGGTNLNAGEASPQTESADVPPSMIYFKC